MMTYALASVTNLVDSFKKLDKEVDVLNAANVTVKDLEPSRFEGANGSTMISVSSFPVTEIIVVLNIMLADDEFSAWLRAVAQHPAAYRDFFPKLQAVIIL